MRLPRPNLLASPAGRRWLFAVAYLSEGAPIGFVWWAMPTLLREQGIGLDAITTLTTLATLPWVFKFLIAPFIDAGVHRGIGLKRWILTSQLGMCAALLPLAAVDWRAQFTLVVVVIVAHAMCAAVQDVGIDTLAIRVVPPGELGRVNGWMQAGMLGGRASVAAGTTWLSAALGDPGWAVLVLVGLIALPGLLLLVAVDEPPPAGALPQLGRIARLVVTRTGVAGLAIALLIGAGFEFFGVSAGPRLVDLDVSEAGIATFYGLLAPAGLALGALTAGRLADRVGPVRSTGVSLAVLSAVLVWVAVGDLVPGRATAPLVSSVAAYLGIGALTASSYALLMTLARGEFAATRFSVFMAMTNACEAWSGYIGGRFAESNYGATLLALTTISGLAAAPLYVLWRLGEGRANEGERRPAV